jgi:hypothetical protein
LFQTGQLNAVTSSGHTVSGFSSLSNKSDGYWRSAPLYKGTYDIYVGDSKTRKKMHAYIDIVQLGQRLDFDLNNEDHCFGAFIACENVAF